MNKIFAIFLSVFPSFAFCAELGVSGSEHAISGDIWSHHKAENGFGFYFRILLDFDEYEDGTTVSVCSDGSISGSSGSGTCSGHGGVNHEKIAEFERYALILGPTYRVTDKIRLHGGLVMGIYTSDINIGEEDKKDFTEYGVDVGVSYSLFGIDGAKVVLSYETEQDQPSLGISFPI